MDQRRGLSDLTGYVNVNGDEAVKSKSGGGEDEIGKIC